MQINLMVILGHLADVVAFIQKVLVPPALQDYEIGCKMLLHCVHLLMSSVIINDWHAKLFSAVQHCFPSLIVT